MTFGKRSNTTVQSSVNPVAYAATLKGETEAQAQARIARDWTGPNPVLPTLTGKTR